MIRYGPDEQTTDLLKPESTQIVNGVEPPPPVALRPGPNGPRYRAREEHQCFVAVGLSTCSHSGNLEPPRENRNMFRHLI